MKALEKDRNRRYETVNGFALDILRPLANEPVLAAAPSATYRFRKFARRNKAGLSVAALIAVVLVAATGISVWQAKLARKAAADALEAKTDATAKAVAERTAREESDTITNFLTGVFERPDPSRDGRTITVAETLDRAAKDLETGLRDQPARRAQLQGTLGSTYFALGLAREAIPLQEKALHYFRTVSGLEHRETIEAMTNLSHSYFGAGRPAEALKLCEEVLTLSRKVNGPEDPNTLMAMTNLAFSYFDAGRAAEALKLGEEALPLCRKVHGPEHPDTLTAMSILAHCYTATGRRDEALRLREMAVPLCRKVHGPRHPVTLTAMALLADSYADTGRRDQALKLREEVLALSREVLGPEHPDTLTLMNNLAVSYGATGRRNDALKLEEEVLALRRKSQGSEHPDTLVAIANLAGSYFDTGHLNEALQLREEVVAVRAKVSGPQHPRHTSLDINNLAISYIADDRMEKALAMWVEASPLFPKDTVLSEKVAALQAWFREEDAHKSTCRRVLALAEKSNVPITAERAALGYCLVPSSDPALLAAALKLARRAVESGRDDKALV